MTTEMMTETTPDPSATGTPEAPHVEEPETEGRGAAAREWLAQLQAMIENLAEQAAPVVREVGAKAAELAALAGEKAGPAAQRAAVFTAEAGQKLAERSRDFAAELRRDIAAKAEEVASPAEDDKA